MPNDPEDEVLDCIQTKTTRKDATMGEFDTQKPEKPGAGATISVFFLCWVLAFICCVIVSMFVGRSYGFMGYSNGGLSMPIVGVLCAVYYHSSGKIPPAAIAAAIAGAVIGFIAVQMAASMYL